MRPYISSDAEEVLALGLQLFNYSELFKEETIENFREYSGLVIEGDGKIEAFLLYTKPNPDLTYLDFIGSSVRGLGRELLVSFLQMAKSSYLHVESNCPSTSALIEWYQRMGFKISPPNPLIYPYLGESDSVMMTRFSSFPLTSSPDDSSTQPIPYPYI